MNGERSRLGYLVPVILFVAFFMACCAVCACVFARAAAVTEEAEQLSAAVQLCRNQAELCRAGLGWEEEVSEARFDESFREAEAGSYWVRVKRSLSEEGLGTAVICAGAEGGEALCTLEVKVYLPGREA
ncbi:MAG: hypothetical protein ACI4P4_13155 [Faecousia sp.]